MAIYRALLLNDDVYIVSMLTKITFAIIRLNESDSNILTQRECVAVPEERLKFRTLFEVLNFINKKKLNGATTDYFHL